MPVRIKLQYMKRRRNNQGFCVVCCVWGFFMLVNMQIKIKAMPKTALISRVACVIISYMKELFLSFNIPN